MTRPIVFVDANALWHRRLAEALAEQGLVTAINPRSGLWPNARKSTANGVSNIALTVPRGWASGTAFIGQRLVLRAVRSQTRAMGGSPVVMLTSPAYAPLAEWLRGELPVAAYIADDYRSYEGWGGERVIERERRLLRAADLSVFVSESLRARAVDEYDIDPARTFVSPNATERRFAAGNAPLPPELAGRPGPIAGVLGALTDRLDLDLLAHTAALDEIGTFLVAGPASEDVLDRYPVFRSGKCVVTGFLDHARMHEYAIALDLALIAYRPTELNRHCSPMRLYDHLAAGAPILALEGCDQIDRAARRGLEIACRADFADRAKSLATANAEAITDPDPDIFWDFRSKALRSVLDGVGRDEAAIGQDR